MHEHAGTWNISITFLFGEFLMEYHWRPCIQLVPIFWFPIRAFDAYFFEPLPNKSITGHLCMNMRPHETFQLHFFLVSMSWSTIEDLAFNLCLFFGSPLELSMHIFLDLCSSESKTGHFVQWTWGHMKYFNYISFWWVSHGVPLKTLHSTCAYFLVHH